MMRAGGWLGGLLLLLLASSAADVVYTDTYAAHIEGGPGVAARLAAQHGFTYLGEIMPDFYHLRHKRVAKRSVEPSFHHEPLVREAQVRWMEQQIVKRRVKRDTMFNDPKWARMWYLRRGSGLDMNVKPAWRKGYTGRGVVVSILDDGIEKDHPDLKKNYDAKASTDINGHDPDPQPRYDYTNENRHGTRCAGEVAAEANNGICSVGVAYDASIGGVRMLDGDVTDAVESMSLSHNPQHIDVYSASWGPDDDGRTVDGPGYLARKAFFDGITKGRHGLGSIFVWASGNGGRDGDSCNCDGYTNSIYTLSISSATENGNVPWYSEACSSTLATTYSSGGGGERQIVTTDLRKSCTEGHTGTSASAPLAAGICALALQANPNLTWRDLQHIVVMTARPEKLIATDWVTNGVGRRVSHHFGYGLMDASAMVEMALNWTNVPPQRKCEITYYGGPHKISSRGTARMYLESNGCQGDPLHTVLYVEHVAAHITLSASSRGDVQIYLTSPVGTKSTLLQRRSRDHSMDGFNNWAFMTTHNWGELSYGQWTLEVETRETTSELKSWSLVIYGTASNPQSGPRHRPRPQDPGQDCDKDEFILENYCYKECPVNFFPTNETVAPLNLPDADNTTTLPGYFNMTDNVTSLQWGPQPVCHMCSVVCSDCFGPSMNQCMDCAPGFELQNFTCVRSLQEEHVHMNDFILIAVIGCSLAVIIFFVIFFVLQCVYPGRDIKYKDIRTSFTLNSDKPIRYSPQNQNLLDSASEDEDSMFDVEVEDALLRN